MNILYFHPDTQISKAVFMFLTGCPVLPGRTLKYSSSPRAGCVLCARAAGVSGYVYSNADECRLPRDGGTLQCLWSLPAGPWAESDAVLQVNPCSPWVWLPSARPAKAPAGSAVPDKGLSRDGLPAIQAKWARCTQLIKPAIYWSRQAGASTGFSLYWNPVCHLPQSSALSGIIS